MSPHSEFSLVPLKMLDNRIAMWNNAAVGPMGACPGREGHVVILSIFIFSFCCSGNVDYILKRETKKMLYQSNQKNKKKNDILGDCK